MLLDERQIKFCSLRKQYLSSKNLFCGKPKNCIFRRHIFSEKDKSNSRCETCDMVNIPFWITRHGSACMNSIGESRRKDKESDSKDEKKDRSVNGGNNHRSYIDSQKCYWRK